MTPRDYQADCITAAETSLEEHNSTMAVLPTGTGKTVIFTTVGRDWDNGRVLVICPSIQLIGQTANKIQRICGEKPAIEQAKNYSNEHYKSRYVVASKQTLTGQSKRYKRLSDIGLVIVDECHYATTTRYAEMLDHYQQAGAKVLGVTATPNRHDKRAMKLIFEDCCYNMGIHEAIQQGWLVEPTCRQIRLESLDLTGVSTRGSKGDFKESELAEVMEDEKVVCEITAITAAESGDLKTVIYCASVKEARMVADRLKDTYGKNSGWVCGDKRLCPDEERKRVLDGLTQGDIQFVANVGVLTTGWDFPGLEHIVMARPTRSLSLYTQILGRGTRPLAGVVDFPDSTAESRRAAIAASGKPTWKITDLVDNSAEHKLMSAVDVLGGRMDLLEQKFAKEALEKKQMTIEEALAAGADMAYIERLWERKRMKQIEARAKYIAQDVSVFGGSSGSVRDGVGRVPRMLFGKHKGMPITDVSTGYLGWMINKCNLRGWFKDAVANEYNARKAHAK